MNFLYPLAKRFIAGHDFDSAKRVIDKLMEEGYEVSIDYLGELSKTVGDCCKAKRQYIKIIKFYTGKDVDISIKPTQLGLLLDQTSCFNNLLEIARKAKRAGHTIRLDMEDSRVTQETINLAVALNRICGNVGVAIQANLFRTKQDLKDLIDEKVSVRLVKGAYKESKEVALQTDPEIEEAFFFYAADLSMEGANRPAIGTHDESLLYDIRKMLPRSKEFDYEFLYGIRRDLQRRLKRKKNRVRIYVPFGTDWLPYCWRRLKEWKNLMFVGRSIIKEWFSNER